MWLDLPCEFSFSCKLSHVFLPTSQNLLVGVLVWLEPQNVASVTTP